MVYHCLGWYRNNGHQLGMSQFHLNIRKMFCEDGGLLFSGGFQERLDRGCPAYREGFNYTILASFSNSADRSFLRPSIHLCSVEMVPCYLTRKIEYRLWVLLVF